MAAKKNPQDYHFPDTEAPTWRVGIDCEVAMLSNAYREMSPKDQKWFLALAQLRAWSKPSN